MASDLSENAFLVFMEMVACHGKLRFFGDDQMIQQLLDSVEPDSDLSKVSSLSVVCTACEARMLVKEVLLDVEKEGIVCRICESDALILACERAGGIQ